MANLDRLEPIHLLPSFSTTAFVYLYPLLSVFCLPSSVLCYLSSVICLPSSVICLLLTAYCILLTAYSILHTPYCVFQLSNLHQSICFLRNVGISRSSMEMVLSLPLSISILCSFFLFLKNVGISLYS